MRTLSRTLTVTASSLAVVAAALVGMVPADAAGGQDVAPQPARSHWADGAPLAGRSAAAPGQVVRDYLAGHGVGAAAAGLQVSSSWSSGKLSYLRLGQSVQGLRVPGTDVKAVFADGALVSVVENAARVGGPVKAASVTPDDALRAAVADLYPGRSVSTAGARRSGNVTTYAQQGFSAAPTVEKVALPTTDGRAAAGYVVTTWDTDNVLTLTTVDSAGAVVDREVRTNNDTYNVFPEDPDKTKQSLVTDPADPNYSENGWLSGTQWSNHISGNNANAYLDTDNDNAPDADAAPVGNEIFGAVWDGTVQPDEGDNQAVAVQNL
ncbi:MAG: M36 family metallopeptidase, partial [Nocardioides sp.]